VVVFLALSGCAQGYYTAHVTIQPSYDSDKTIVLGHITERATGKFLQARIEVESTMITTTADEEGYYRLVLVSHRKYRIRVALVDFIAVSHEINTQPNQTIELNLELKQGISQINE
jgi:hypothetical protein